MNVKRKLISNENYSHPPPPHLPFFLSVAFSSSSVLSLALVCRLQCLKRWYFHFTSSRIVVFFLCFLGKKEKKKHRRRKLKAMITVDWNTEISRWTTLTHSLNIHHTFCDCRSGNSRSFTELQDCVPTDWWNDERRSGNGVWVIKIDKIFFFLLCHFLCRMNVLMCGLLYIARKYESKPPFLSFCTDIAAKRNPSGLFNFEMRNKFFNSDAKNFCLTHCSSFVLESFIVFFFLVRSLPPFDSIFVSSLPCSRRFHLVVLKFVFRLNIYHPETQSQKSRKERRFLRCNSISNIKKANQMTAIESTVKTCQQQWLW